MVLGHSIRIEDTLPDASGPVRFRPVALQIELGDGHARLLECGQRAWQFIRRATDNFHAARIGQEHEYRRRADPLVLVIDALRMLRRRRQRLTGP